MFTISRENKLFERLYFIFTSKRSVDWGRLVNQCDMRHFMGNAHTIALAELLHFYLINFDQINLDSFYVEIINIDANTHYYESEFFWAKKLGRKKMLHHDIK